MKRILVYTLTLMISVAFLVGCNKKDENVTSSKSIYEQPIDARNYIKLKKHLANMKEESEKKLWDGYIYSIQLIAAEADNSLGFVYGQNSVDMYSSTAIIFNECIEKENQKLLDLLDGKTPVEVMQHAMTVHENAMNKYVNK